MSGVSASTVATIYDLPNYYGELLSVSPQDTPFLSAIGGLSQGGYRVNSTLFEGQSYDLSTPAQPAILEAADISTYTERARSNWVNVAQIFQYGIGVSYTKQAATARMATAAAAGIMNPVQNELDWQVEQYLKIAARDVNYSFIRGAYQLPTDNTTARKTRGILEAITTNAVSNLDSGTSVTGTASANTITFTAHGLKVGDVVYFTAKTGGSGVSLNTNYYVVSVVDADTFKISTSPGGSVLSLGSNLTSTTTLKRGTVLTKTLVLDLIQLVYNTVGIDMSLEPTIVVNATLKRSLSKMFVTDMGYTELTRNVGGVNVQSIETDFGRINMLLERNMPFETIALVHLGACAPAFLEIPGKGFLFLEPLAKTGASEKYQLYGEVGLWHGPEQLHGKLTGVSPVSGF
jgi:hypothetical protein